MNQRIAMNPRLVLLTVVVVGAIAAMLIVLVPESPANAIIRGTSYVQTDLCYEDEQAGMSVCQPVICSEYGGGWQQSHCGPNPWKRQDSAAAAQDSAAAAPDSASAAAAAAAAAEHADQPALRTSDRPENHVNVRDRASWDWFSQFRR